MASENTPAFVKYIDATWDKVFSMDKRFLVYKSWNGQIHASIEYGELQTGEGKKKDTSEIKRFEIGIGITDIELLKKAYPLEIETNESSTVNV